MTKKLKNLKSYNKKKLKQFKNSYKNHKKPKTT